MFDRLNGNLIISISIVLTIIGVIFTPIVTNIYLLAILVVSNGFLMGVLDTGGNVIIIWLHGKEVGPCTLLKLSFHLNDSDLQALHFFFGLGSFISPLIVGGVMDIDNGDPSWAFWLLAILCAPLPFWLLCYKSPRRQETDTKNTDEKQKFGYFEWVLQQNSVLLK